MTFNLNWFIEERIKHYLENTEYVELEYQKQLIFDTVRFNIYTLSRYPMERAKVGIQGQFDMYEAQSRFVNLNNTPYYLDSLEIIYPMKFLKEQIFWEDVEDFNVLNDGTDWRPDLKNSYTDVDKNLIAKAKEIWLENELSKKADLIDNFMMEGCHYPVPVIHLDVGMGKTLIGILTMVITIETFIELNKFLYSIIGKNKLFNNVKTNNPFEKAQLKDFQINFIIIPIMKREIEKMIYKLNLNDKINIKFINNNSLKDFQETLDPKNIFSKMYHQMGDMLAILYIDWAYSFIKSNYDEEQTENFLLNSLLQGYGTYRYDVEELEEDYASWKLSLEELKKKFIDKLYRLTDEITSKADLPLCIIDEFSSKKTPIYREDNDFITLFQPFLWKWKHLGLVGVGLTASYNDSIRPEIWFFTYTADYFSKFFEKKDVIKELVEKKLYNDVGFLYKNIYMNNKKIATYQEKLDVINKLSERILEISNQKQQDLNAIFNTFNKLIENFLKNEAIMEEKKEYDNGENLIQFVQNLDWLKAPIEETLNNDIIKSVIEEKEKVNKDLENFKKESFYDIKISDILEDKGLVNLKDEKTIYLLDHEYKRLNENAIKELVKWFEANDIKVFQKEWFNRDVLDETLDSKEHSGIVFVGYVDEIGKGLNLQDFDNIVILYANQCSFDDIYQSLGRVDRLGSNWKMKEVFLVHFEKNEEMFKKLIEKRKEISFEVKIEEYNIIKNIDLKAIRENYQNIENQIQYIDSIIEKNNFKEILKRHENLMEDTKINISKEQLELYQNTKDVVFELLKSISDELKNQLNYIRTVLKDWTWLTSMENIGKTNIVDAIETIKLSIWID